MSRLYHYVGPLQILKDVQDQLAGTRLHSPQDILAWMQAHQIHPDIDDCITVTFTVTPAHQFLIADRHSEHVACAAGGPVLAAGEATFELTSPIQLIDISNQSTGFCPEPDCWSEVKIALEKANIPHPGRFTRSFVFRLCEHCGQRNLVKEQWFECAVCSQDLPRHWNFTPTETSST